MKFFVPLAVFGLFSIQLSAQVGIGTSTPHSSAKLEVRSSTQGFLPPRVSLTSTNAASPVTSPEAGLLVYNIAPNGSGATAVTPGFYYWGGSAWVRLIVPTDNAANVTGTVAVANGGTGATTLTGILKGNGTSAFTTATAGTDYLAPNGSAANLNNFPTLNQNTTGTAGNVTGVVAVANGGTGASTLTGILKGNGTDAFTAAVAGTDYQAPISGTTNFLPKVTAAATVGNSQVFDNGASVGIGLNTPNTFAKLDVSSTTQGFLPPRMTYAQRISNLASPGSSAAGLIIFCTDCGSSGELQLFNGSTWVNIAGGSSAAPIFNCGTSTVTFTYKGASVTYGTVQGANSKCWLDRNLGAQRVATSKTDELAYGDLFQWGRGDDGHQSVSWTNSQTGTGTATTTTLSTTDNPGNANFITGSGSFNDWRSTPNTNLWQGVNGTNNVCPSGWRLPTQSELQTEINTWASGTNSRDKAFNSVLKFPITGNRASNASNTQISGGESVFSSASYLWTSTTSSGVSRALIIARDSDVIPLEFHSQHRASGYSVRCIKD